MKTFVISAVLFAILLGTILLNCLFKVVDVLRFARDAHHTQSFVLVLIVDGNIFHCGTTTRSTPRCPHIYIYIFPTEF